MMKCHCIFFFVTFMEYDYSGVTSGKHIWGWGMNRTKR